MGAGWGGRMLLSPADTLMWMPQRDTQGCPTAVPVKLLRRNRTNRVCAREYACARMCVCTEIYHKEPPRAVMKPDKSPDLQSKLASWTPRFSRVIAGLKANQLKTPEGSTFQFKSEGRKNTNVSAQPVRQEEFPLTQPSCPSLFFY